MAYKKPQPVLISGRVESIKRTIDSTLRMTVYQTCLNCAHWKEGKEECGLYNSRPPAEVIVYSCAHWQELQDWDIPF